MGSRTLFSKLMGSMEPIEPMLTTALAGVTLVPVRVNGASSLQTDGQTDVFGEIVM